MVNRDEYDYDYFERLLWPGIMVGSCGYPNVNQHGQYCIAGGNKDSHFKATAIEFYGIKTQY